MVRTRAQAARNSSSVNGPKSALLSLPPEIRNNIYIYVFDGKGCLDLWGNYEQPKHHVFANCADKPYAPRPDLSLLFVCRQVYSEAALLAYSKIPLVIGTGPVRKELQKLAGLVDASFTLPDYTQPRLATLATKIGLDKISAVSHLVIRDNSKLWSFVESAKDPVSVICEQSSVRELLKGLTTITFSNDRLWSEFVTLKEGEAWIHQELSTDQLAKLIRLYPKLREIRVITANREPRLNEFWQDCELEVEVCPVVDGVVLHPTTGEVLVSGR